MVVDNGCDIGHPNLPTPHEAYSFASNRAQAAGASRPEMLNPGDSSHGTMSAGMVVGKPDDGAGFLGGVAADLSGVEFCPVRYNPSVDFNSDKAMYEKLLTAGAKVITNSFGWVVTTNQRVQFETMIRDASAVFIFAAGNETKELKANTIFYNAIYVSASIPGDTLADEAKVPASNYGPGIIVCAPGGAADNQAPISTVNVGKGTQGGNFDAYSDTSAACAIVAGVVTLMLLAKPTLTPSKVKDILAKTADKINPGLTSGYGKWNAKALSVLNGDQQTGLSNEALNRPYSKYYGFGRVNAEEAVKLAIAS
jgi:Subtilase family